MKAVGAQHYLGLARILLLAHDPTIPSIGLDRRMRMEQIDVGIFPTMAVDLAADKSRSKSESKFACFVVSPFQILNIILRCSLQDQQLPCVSYALLSCI